MNTEPKKYFFDLSSCYSPEDVHAVIRGILPLPEYYGGNLDALYDVLTDPHAPWELNFTGCKTVSAIIGSKYLASLRRACEDAAKESESLTVFFWD